MTISSNAGADAGDPTASYHPTAQFKLHTWWSSSGGLDIHQQHYASFLNDARDVVQGAHTLVELLSWNDVRRQLSQLPARHNSRLVMKFRSARTLAGG